MALGTSAIRWGCPLCSRLLPSLPLPLCAGFSQDVETLLDGRSRAHILSAQIPGKKQFPSLRAVLVEISKASLGHVPSPMNQVVLAQATIIEYRRLGGWSNKHLFLTQASLVGFQFEPFPGFYMATFLLCPPTGRVQGEEASLVMSLGRALIPLMQLCLNLITSQRSHLLIPSLWGLRSQHINVVGTQNSV